MAIVNTEIKQKTIKKEMSLSGVGLHTGKKRKPYFQTIKS